MPFTLAHPAAVIPIYRLATSLSLPALVIGSLSRVAAAASGVFTQCCRSHGRCSHRVLGKYWNRVSSVWWPDKDLNVSSSLINMLNFSFIPSTRQMLWWGWIFRITEIIGTKVIRR